MPTLTNLPNGRKTYFDNNGTPLSGGLVHFYVPGTTQPAAIYQDDQGTVASPNPIVLDAGGGCVAFGCGEYREYVTDSDGNVISDTVVTAVYPEFSIPTITIPNVPTPTPTPTPTPPSSGGNMTATSLNIYPANEHIGFAPTANALASIGSLNVQGTTVTPGTREFMVNLGLTSNQGAGYGGKAVGGSNPDKVTLYTGAVGMPGTFDLWAQNICITQEAGSGSYNCQGLEIDLNNLNSTRGASGSIAADFAAPISNGLTVTGLGTFTNTAGISVESLGGTPSQPQWARGYVNLGTNSICGWHDWTSAPVGFQFDGHYAVAGINFTNTYGNGGGTTQTALYMKQNMYVAWQGDTETTVISDAVTAGNNRMVGLGSSGVFFGASVGVGPINSGIALGTPSNLWGYIYTNQGGVTTVSDVRFKKDIQSLPAALDLIAGVDPIAFKWKDERDTKLHYGFSADDIRDSMGADHAAYQEHEDSKFIVKDELIAVLWKGVQELTQQVKELQAEVAALKSA